MRTRFSTLFDRKFIRYMWTCVFCYALLHGSVCAQITVGSIEGHIYEKGRAPIPLKDVTIALKNNNTGRSARFTTDQSGRYYFANISPDTYTIIISKPGYKTERIANAYIQLGHNSGLDMSLEPESVQLEGVNIVHSPTRSMLSATGIHLQQSMIDALPNIGRSLSDLTRVTPESNNNSFGGANYRYNNITLDGAVNNDAIAFSNSVGGVSGSGQAGTAGSGSRANPYSMDVIKEVQVQLSDYDARLGNATGGTINAVTKSGGNDFHADAYTFFRNGHLVGRSVDAARTKMPSDFSDWQYGLSTSGPIVQKKLFYFVNAELTNRTDPVFFGAGAPNAAITEQDGGRIAAHLMNKYKYNPGNYTQPYTIGQHSEKFFLRLDYNISDKHQFMLRTNVTFGRADNLERSSSQIQFGSAQFTQHTRQTNTVIELKSNLSSAWNNQFIASYVHVHDFRDFPRYNGVAAPFIEINGATQIWLGTWREASVYDQRQRTIEMTNNITYKANKHFFTLGTHNELYFIQYGFLNAWNGRWEYASIDDFLKDQPSRIRGTYHLDPTKNTLAAGRNEPASQFNMNFLSVYAQDEISFNRYYSLLVALRVDVPFVGQRPPLYDKLTHTVRRGFPSPRTIEHRPFSSFDNKWFAYAALSPRVSFVYKPLGNSSVVIRGGSGIFVGRMPLAWLGYAYANTGLSYGNIDYRNREETTISLAMDPEKLIDTIRRISPSATTQRQIDLVDNNFKLPTVWRSSLSVQWKLPRQYMLNVAATFNKTIYDVFFQQINQIDSTSYFSTGPTRSPVYGKGSHNSHFTTVFLLSNTNQGHRYNLSATLSKTFAPLHLGGIMVKAYAQTSYTYGRSFDMANGVRNSMQSNYEYNPSISPNDKNTDVSFSNFDLRHRFVSVVNVQWIWTGSHTTTVSVFSSSQSGSPYTWVYGNSNRIFNARNNAALVYVPAHESEIAFNNNHNQQWKAFNDFVEKDPYLRSRRGKYTERNGARTPWNHILDLKFVHKYTLKTAKRIHTMKFHYTINNLLNLLDNTKGWVYFVPNTNNATLPLLVGTGKVDQAKNTPQLRFPSPRTYTVDAISSRWQMQLGVQYSF